MCRYKDMIQKKIIIAIPVYYLLLVLCLVIFLQTDTNDAAVSSEAQAEPKLVIWGTDVVVAETKERFRQFILNFVCEDMDGEFDPETPLYL